MDSTRSRIVVLGGYGHFGARICRELGRDPALGLVIAGRDGERADALARTLAVCYPQSRICAAALDHESESFSRDLGALNPTLVIHTAGPFQGQDYHVAEACVSVGSHYIDLADGRRFVCDFGELNARATAAGVLLVTGASTLPGVSSAVIDRLATGLELESVAISIAPANQNPRGIGTIAAVLSYCGRPFKTWRESRWVDTYGWQELRRIDYGAFRRWAGACDVPDLELLPTYYEGVNTVSFHAGVELGWQQWGLYFMGWTTRLGLVSDWSQYAGVLSRVSDSFKVWGSDTGAMGVTVIGRTGDGAGIRRSWTLLAGENHGPEIPCVPATVLAKRLASGEITAVGAVPCVSLITLEEFAAATADLDISWEITEHAEAD